MTERVIWAIGGVKFTKKNGELVIPPDDLQYMKVEFVSNFLDKRFKRIPYNEIYIGEFTENHPIGRYLITTPGHITTCIDGYIIDTWDCTDKKIEYIWKVS